MRTSMLKPAAGVVLAGVVWASLTMAMSGAQEQPAEQTTDVAGTQVVVATKPLAPFVFVESDLADGSGLSGYSIDVWNELSTRLGLETTWLVEDTVGEILEDVRMERADAAIAGISMTAEREAFLDFAHPYFDSGLQVATQPVADQSALSSMLGLVTSGPVLLLGAAMVVLTLIVAHLVWLTERRHNPEFPREYSKGISEALWWSTVSVITGGEAVKDIRRPLSRILAVFWMIVGFFLIAFITAQAASSLTVSELQNDIGGPEDLPGHSVVTVEGTVAESYLQSVNISASTVADVEAAMGAVAEGRFDAVVYDAPVLSYLIQTVYPGRVALAGSTFAPDPSGIALQTGSELREPINAALLEMFRDGTLEELNLKWLGVSR
ncbi:MAG: transporter substrate-binding domain-containing protein [Acidimicrobiales bacterium]